MQPKSPKIEEKQDWEMKYRIEQKLSSSSSIPVVEITKYLPSSSNTLQMHQ